MYQKKKMTGKGHTLYEYDLPKSEVDVWVLIAESCYEISQTLLAEDSYAEEIYFSLSGYQHNSDRGGLGIRPEGYVRYPMQLYRELDRDPRVHVLIEELFSTIRRVQVRVSCAPWVVPLFYQQEKEEERFVLLEKIRNKFSVPDVIGMGLEGIKNMRISTYTPKRSDEIRRAFKLLSLKPGLLKLLGKAAEKSYWYRIY